ncbi:MAG TPA: DUF2231 domain-containing protein [Gemmatimonadaceae bacterium]|nr:DUF2231 domain-containing protein [Gemmatimonadaceae bacterium]
MLPDPLHPAAVHFPVVLAFLLPLFAAGALWAIRRGSRPLRAWAVPLALAGALAASAWAAVETGEAQEERVERVVTDRPLDAHEDAAGLFLALSGVLLLVTGAGLVPGVVGRSARLLATAGAAALVVGAVRVGHTGGALVYRHGAASAYGPAAAAGGSAAAPASDASTPRVASNEHDRHER